MGGRSSGFGNHPVYQTMNATDLASMFGPDSVSRQCRTWHPGHHNDRWVIGVEVDRLGSDTGARERDESVPLMLGSVAVGGLEDLDDEVRVVEGCEHVVGHPACQPGQAVQCWIGA